MDSFSLTGPSPVISPTIPPVDSQLFASTLTVPNLSTPPLMPSQYPPSSEGSYEQTSTTSSGVLHTSPQAINIPLGTPPTSYGGVSQQGTSGSAPAALETKKFKWSLPFTPRKKRTSVSSMSSLPDATRSPPVSAAGSSFPIDPRPYASPPFAYDAPFATGISNHDPEVEIHISDDGRVLAGTLEGLVSMMVTQPTS